jgi:hypothetical protein
VKLKALALACALAFVADLALAEPMLAPPDVVRILYSKGFRAISRPMPRGSNYEVRALDRRGVPVRVVVDARVGEVLVVRPRGAPAITVAPFGQSRPTTALRPPAAVGRQRPAVEAPAPSSAPPPASAEAEIAAPPEHTATKPVTAPTNAAAPEASPARTAGPSPHGGAFPPVTPLE